jgi:hypothetical protein
MKVGQLLEVATKEPKVNLGPFTGIVTKERRVRLGQMVEMAAIGITNVVLGGNLISLGLITNPRRMIYNMTESVFLYKALHGKMGLPAKQVFEVLPSDNVMEIKLGNFTYGTWFWNASFGVDIVSLCLLCQILKPKVVFEIGTLAGYGAFHFALNTPDDTRIYSLDLPKDESINPAMKITVGDGHTVKKHIMGQRYAFANSPVGEKVTCLFGDSAAFDYSPYHGKVDLFFVDGAHSYEYVRSDTLNALACCHPGSVIAWHDCGRVANGVAKWLKEWSKEGHDISVIPGGSLAFMVVK